MQSEIWGLTRSRTAEHERPMIESAQRLWHRLDAGDASCNRLKYDSELSRLHESRGAMMSVSPVVESLDFVGGSPEDVGRS